MLVRTRKVISRAPRVAQWLFAMIAAANLSSCWEECRNELNWCEGQVLRTCEVSTAGGELGRHDIVGSSSCAKLGAVCQESLNGRSAACVLPDQRCDSGAESVCRGSTLHRCFDGVARLDVGKQIGRAEECEHACMLSHDLGKSYCAEPDSECDRGGRIRCLEILPGSSQPDFEFCVDSGWRALGECGLGYCGDPENESDPCVSLPAEALPPGYK
jgi:hypothetical protein